MIEGLVAFQLNIIAIILRDPNQGDIPGPGN